MNTSPKPRVPGRWIRAVAVALVVIALLLFVGSLRVGWPHPAYLLLVIVAGCVLVFGNAVRERRSTFWPLAVWITLTMVARRSFYDHATILSWRSAQHYSVLMLSALAPVLYLMWRFRYRSASKREGPPSSPSLPTKTWTWRRTGNRS
jgi:hypothetical protein